MEETRQLLERLAGGTTDGDLKEFSIRKIAEALAELQQAVQADREFLAEELSRRRAEYLPTTDERRDPSR